MRRFFILILFCLTGCATPEETKVVFIDSNVSANVYIGDVKVGVTPYAGGLSGDEREMISLRKTGYKTAYLPLETVYKGNYRPGFFYAMTGATSSNCNKYKYGGRKSEMKAKNGCEYVFMMVFGSLTYGLGTSYALTDATPDPVFVQYDRDSYFVEMIPENKKAFTKEELKKMRTRLMVLRTFNELKAASPEYRFALSRLTGKPFVAPAPDMTPGAYLRLIEN